MAANDLTTVQSVKDNIELPSNDQNLDQLIPELITEASSRIIEFCQREFAPVVTQTRRFRVDGYRVDFAPWDLQSATAVVLHPEAGSGAITLGDGTNGTNQQYMLKPINPARGVYQSMQFSGYLVIVSQTLMAFNYALVDVTGTWGFPSVPDEVKRACNITVGSWLTKTSPGFSGAYGIPAMSATGGVTFRNDWDIPWAARKLLVPFRRSSARWAF